MTEFTTIAANWRNFQAFDIAPDAPQEQRDEMRRAFYAGAASILLLAVRAAHAMPTDNGAAVMVLREELNAFVATGKVRAAIAKASSHGR